MESSSVGAKRSWRRGRAGRLPPQICLMLWDMAGQEELDALTESYYRDIPMVLVLNKTASPPTRWDPDLT